MTRITTKRYATLMSHSKRRLPLAHSSVSAGPALDLAEGYDLIDVNETITSGRDDILSFEVSGDSMVPDIRPGYTVFVDPIAEPRNGDAVIAEMNGLYSVKLYERNRRGLYLVPANNEYPAREVRHTDNFRVLGVVIGHLAVYRKLMNCAL